MSPLSDLRRTSGPVLALVDGGGPGRDQPGRDCDGIELVRRIAGGDGAAMAELYRLHGGVVLAQIVLMVGERALAEEVLQDTMLAVWHQAGSFRGDSRVRSWLIAIARRQGRDRLRRHRLRVVDDAVLTRTASSEPGPELVALTRVEVAQVADAILRLSLAHREVLGLALGSGLSLAEVAEVLEVPVGTVKSRLAAARVALGRMLIEKGHHR
jgi:RNA polymerase sigma-70 factor, ECF subfamily